MAIGKPREEDIELEEDHWAVILALQEFFAHHDDHKQVNRRVVHDALNEKFYYKGPRLSIPVASWRSHRATLSTGRFGDTSRQSRPILRQYLAITCFVNPGTRECCAGGRPRIVSNQSTGRSDC